MLLCKTLVLVIIQPASAQIPALSCMYGGYTCFTLNDPSAPVPCKCTVPCGGGTELRISYLKSGSDPGCAPVLYNYAFPCNTEPCASASTTSTKPDRTTITTSTRPRPTTASTTTTAGTGSSELAREDTTLLIVIACLVALLVLAVLIYLCRRRQRRLQREKLEHVIPPSQQQQDADAVSVESEATSSDYGGLGLQQMYHSGGGNGSSVGGMRVVGRSGVGATMLADQGSSSFQNISHRNNNNNTNTFVSSSSFGGGGGGGDATAYAVPTQYHHQQQQQQQQQEYPPHQTHTNPGYGRERLSSGAAGYAVPQDSTTLNSRIVMMQQQQQLQQRQQQQHQQQQQRQSGDGDMWEPLPPPMTTSHLERLHSGGSDGGGGISVSQRGGSTHRRPKITANGSVGSTDILFEGDLEPEPDLNVSDTPSYMSMHLNRDMVTDAVGTPLTQPLDPAAAQETAPRVQEDEEIQEAQAQVGPTASAFAVQMREKKKRSPGGGGGGGSGGGDDVGGGGGVGLPGLRYTLMMKRVDQAERIKLAELSALGEEGGLFEEEESGGGLPSSDEVMLSDGAGAGSNGGKTDASNPTYAFATTTNTTTAAAAAVTLTAQENESIVDSAEYAYAAPAASSGAGGDPEYDYAGRSFGETIVEQGVELVPTAFSSSSSPSSSLADAAPANNTATAAAAPVPVALTNELAPVIDPALAEEGGTV
eukprot:UC1_evm2s1744